MPAVSRSHPEHDQAFLLATTPDALAQQFSHNAIMRGANYLARNLVARLARRSAETFEAIVHGGRPYEVSVSTKLRMRPRIEGFCECPAFADVGACKHMVAVALAARAQLNGGLPAPAKAPSGKRILQSHERVMLHQVRPSSGELALWRQSEAAGNLLSLRLSDLMHQAPAGVTVETALADPVGVLEAGPLVVTELAALIKRQCERLRAVYREERQEQLLQSDQRQLSETLARINAVGSAEVRKFAALAAQHLAELRDEASPRSVWQQATTSDDVRLMPGRPRCLRGSGVELVLGSWRTGALECRGLFYAHDPSSEARLLAEALLILADATHRLHAGLTSAILQEDDALILSGLDELLASVDPVADHILSWRFHLGAGHVRFEPYVHKPNRKGHSAGTALRDPRDERLALLPQDDMALARASAGDTRVVEALIGHPRVFEQDALTVPWTVSLGQLSVRTIDHKDGRVSLAMYLGTVPLTLGAVVDRAYVVAADRPSNTLLFARLSPLHARLLQHLASAPAILPAAAKPKLLERIVQLEQRVAVGLSDSLRGNYKAPELTWVARFVPSGGSLCLQLLVEPLGEGLALVPGAGQLEVSRAIGSERWFTTRDFSAEKAAADALWESLHLSPSDDYRTAALDNDALLDLLVQLREDSARARVDWPKQLPRPWIAPFDKMSQLSLRVTKRNDWFSLAGTVQVDGEQAQLAQVALALRERKKYVALDDGRWLAIATELRAQLAPLEALVSLSPDGAKLTLAAARAVAELGEAGAAYDADAQFDALVKRIAASADKTHALPARLNATLRPYQQEGFAWLARLADWGIGGCLADDMGLGKTLQAIALLLHRAKEGPALIVCPTSLVFNWQRELGRFAPSLKVFDYSEKMPKKLAAGHVVIVSYGMLAKQSEALAARAFATSVFDEAHALKNTDTQRSKAARALNLGLAIGLSGTPIENRLSELWSLFSVLAPGLLGDAATFRSRFSLPIESKRDPHARQLLAQILSPFILRRTKAAVAPELPPKEQIDVAVELSPAELALYETLRESKVAALRNAKNKLTGQRARIAVLAALTELRMAADDHRLIDETQGAMGSKLTELMRLVGELRDNGHRALVFSQFTSFMDLIERALKESAVGYQRLDGATPATARKQRIDAFERGDGDVFLLSLHAGGTGLNLTSADFVIMMDPWWNPAVEDQAIGRAHRIGQVKPVTVYRLFSRATIEEKILAMHVDKRELVAAVMDNASTAPSSLTGDQLMALIEDAHR